MVRFWKRRGKIWSENMLQQCDAFRLAIYLVKRRNLSEACRDFREAEDGRALFGPYLSPKHIRAVFEPFLTEALNLHCLRPNAFRTIPFPEATNYIVRTVPSIYLSPKL